MKALCREVLQKEGNGNHFIFNSTGGTKLMSCVAWRVFEHQGPTIIYVDTAHGTIHLECKTIGYKEKTSDEIYKLDSLKERTAGLFGVGVLLSALLSAQNPPREVLSRAAINNQIVLGPEDIGRLKQQFKKLIRGFS